MSSRKAGLVQLGTIHVDTTENWIIIIYNDQFEIILTVSVLFLFGLL